MVTGTEESQESQPAIISYVKDLPNLCSLAGLVCTVLAIYFSIIGVYYAAMIGMIWAVVFDWADGLVARRMKGHSRQSARNDPSRKPGAPGTTRTCDLLVRNQTLYPTELRAPLESGRAF